MVGNVDFVMSPDEETSSYDCILMNTHIKPDSGQNIIHAETGTIKKFSIRNRLQGVVLDFDDKVRISSKKAWTESSMVDVLPIIEGNNVCVNSPDPFSKYNDTDSKVQLRRFLDAVKSSPLVKLTGTPTQDSTQRFQIPLLYGSNVTMFSPDPFSKFYESPRTDRKQQQPTHVTPLTTSPSQYTISPSSPGRVAVSISCDDLTSLTGDGAYGHAMTKVHKFLTRQCRSLPTFERLETSSSRFRENNDGIFDRSIEGGESTYDSISTVGVVERRSPIESSHALDTNVQATRNRIGSNLGSKENAFTNYEEVDVMKKSSLCSGKSGDPKANRKVLRNITNAPENSSRIQSDRSAVLKPECVSSSSNPKFLLSVQNKSSDPVVDVPSIVSKGHPPPDVDAITITVAPPSKPRNKPLSAAPSMRKRFQSARRMDKVADLDPVLIPDADRCGPSRTITTEDTHTSYEGETRAEVPTLVDLPAALENLVVVVEMVSKFEGNAVGFEEDKQISSDLCRLDVLSSEQSSSSLKSSDTGMKPSAVIRRGRKYHPQAPEAGGSGTLAERLAKSLVPPPRSKLISREAISFDVLQDARIMTAEGICDRNMNREIEISNMSSLNRSPQASQTVDQKLVSLLQALDGDDSVFSDLSSEYDKCSDASAPSIKTAATRSGDAQRTVALAEIPTLTQKLRRVCSITSEGVPNPKPVKPLARRRKRMGFNPFFFKRNTLESIPEHSGNFSLPFPSWIVSVVINSQQSYLSNFMSEAGYRSVSSVDGCSKGGADSSNALNLSSTLRSHISSTEFRKEEQFSTANNTDVILSNNDRVYATTDENSSSANSIDVSELVRWNDDAYGLWMSNQMFLVLHRRLGVCSISSQSTSVGDDQDCHSDLSGYEFFDAILCNDIDMIKRNFRSGEWHDEMRDTVGNSALAVAVTAGYGQVIKYLVAKGFRLDTQNRFGNTALHFGKELRRNKACEYLIRKGADKYIRNNMGMMYDERKDDL